jgi:hypothetical protein
LLPSAGLLTTAIRSYRYCSRQQCADGTVQLCSASREYRLAIRAEASTFIVGLPESVRPIVEKNLAPKLLELLDMNKELLSKENLSETERNTFLATKAKSAGLSASQLEAILNSGFSLHTLCGILFADDQPWRTRDQERCREGDSQTTVSPHSIMS